MFWTFMFWKPYALTLFMIFGYSETLLHLYFWINLRYRLFHHCNWFILYSLHWNNCNNLFQLSSSRNVTFISYIEYKPPLISQKNDVFQLAPAALFPPSDLYIINFNTYNLWQTNYIIYVDKIVKVCPFPRIITGIKLSSCPKKKFLPILTVWT